MKRTATVIVTLAVVTLALLALVGSRQPASGQPPGGGVAPAPEAGGAGAGPASPAGPGATPGAAPKAPGAGPAAAAPGAAGGPAAVELPGWPKEKEEKEATIGSVLQGFYLEEANTAFANTLHTEHDQVAGFWSYRSAYWTRAAAQMNPWSPRVINLALALHEFELGRGRRLSIRLLDASEYMERQQRWTYLRQLLEAAVASDPGNTDARVQLAAEYTRSGRWRQAVGQYRAIIAAGRSMLEVQQAHSDLARLYAGRGMWDAAVREVGVVTNIQLVRPTSATAQTARDQMWRDCMQVLGRARRMPIGSAQYYHVNALRHELNRQAQQWYATPSGGGGGGRAGGGGPMGGMGGMGGPMMMGSAGRAGM